MDSPALRNRITKHAKSIMQAANLDAGDFSFRVMPTMPVWISMAEEALIKHYRPVWNMRLDGFGNNDPGRGRTGGERSWWDTLHPGREWAAKLRATKTVDDAAGRVRSFLEIGSD